MAKTTVRVLYPAAFKAADVEVYKRTKDGHDEQMETIELDDKLAQALIGAGHAEAVKK